MLQTPLLFKYKLPANRLVRMVVILVGLPLAFAYLAKTNVKALRIEGIFLLSPDQATVFFWVLAGVCTLASVVGIAFVVSSLKLPTTLELHDSFAVLPKAALRPVVLTVKYTAIKRLTVVQVTPSTKMLAIESAVGNSRLLQTNFESVDAFKKFHEALRSRVGG